MEFTIIFIFELDIFATESVRELSLRRKQPCPKSKTMQEWWDTISTFEKILWYISVPFSVILVIQLILTFTGLGGEKQIDSEDATDIQETGVREKSTYDARLKSWMAPAFHVFTMRNIIAFMTFFGWTGLLCVHLAMSRCWVLGIAFIAGLLAMMLLTLAFFLYKKKNNT